MSVKNQPISAVQSTCVTAGWSDDGIGHAGMNQSLLCKVRVRTGHWLEEGIRLAQINQSVLWKACVLQPIGSKKESDALACLGLRKRIPGSSLLFGDERCRS